MNINTNYLHHPTHYIADLNCTGNEDSIWNCPHNILTDQTCSPASIACYEGNFYDLFIYLVHYLKVDLFHAEEYNNCSDNEVRLSGGSTSLSGRVEICHRNVWFGISGYRWSWYSNHASKTVCSSLGYSDQCQLQTLHKCGT